MSFNRVVTIVAVCGGVAVLLLAGTLRPVEGLRCRTSEGPSTEDVKRIVQTCLNKITNPTENRSSAEYPNYDSSYSDDSSEERHTKVGENGKRLGKRRDSNDHGTDRAYGNGRTMGRPEMGDRWQMDNRGQRNGRPRMDQTGRGQRERYDDDDRNDDDDSIMMMRDYGRQHRRRKRQYYGQGSPMGAGSGGDFSNGHVRTTPAQLANGSTGNGSNVGPGNSSLERDRACLMQCFFEELKATNADGFPEKHKVLHVITKDIRERDLHEFHVDSIQECFRMIDVDNRLKDKCDYSMRFVTCLTDRFQSNCDDWDIDTSAMFR